MFAICIVCRILQNVWHRPGDYTLPANYWVSVGAFITVTQYESLSGKIVYVVFRNEKRVADKPFSSDCCYRLPYYGRPNNSKKVTEIFGCSGGVGDIVLSSRQIARGSETAL